MKNILLLITVAAFFSVTVSAQYSGGGVDYGGRALIATKLDITDGTATNLTVESGLNFPATADGTNYVASLTWDATNKVFIVTETAE